MMLLLGLGSGLLAAVLVAMVAVPRRGHRIMAAIVGCVGIALCLLTTRSSSKPDDTGERVRAACVRTSSRLHLLKSRTQHDSGLTPARLRDLWDGFSDTLAAMGNLCIADMDSCDVVMSNAVARLPRNLDILAEAFETGTGCRR
jgi:xanthosine utilization system XapX-like protein